MLIVVMLTVIMLSVEATIFVALTLLDYHCLCQQHVRMTHTFTSSTLKFITKFYNS